MRRGGTCRTLLQEARNSTLPMTSPSKCGLGFCGNTDSSSSWRPTVCQTLNRKALLALFSSLSVTTLWSSSRFTEQRRKHQRWKDFPKIMGQRPGADPQAQCSCPITAQDQGLTWLCVSRKIKKGALGFSISRKDICLLQGCLIARVKLKRQSILPHNVAEDSYPLLRTSNTSPHICRARSELVLISWLWLCMSSLAALLGAGIFPWKVLLWNWLPHVHGARGHSSACSPAWNPLRMCHFRVSV